MYNKFNLILALFSVTLLILFSSCNDAVSPGIEESLDLFTGLEAIPEASETVVTINLGTNEATDGFFTISVSNIQSNIHLAPGTHEAWCLEWNKNLRSSGDVHRDIKWYSTGSNDKWKPLNYFFSIRDELKNNDPELTFREIQAVVWVLAGEMGIAPKFDVLNLPVDQLPSRLRSGGEVNFSRDKVAAIARRVMEEASEANVPFSSTVAQTASDEQDIIVPPSEADNDAFITTWDTSLGSGTTVTLALAGTVDATIDWGDGTVTNVTTPGPHTHDYGTDGIYTVSVTGSVTAYNSSSNSSFSESQKLLTVESWGDLGFEDLSFAFFFARNLTFVPNSSEGIDGVTDMSFMFERAFNFNSPIGDWNTAAVTDMSFMFNSATSFNQPIGGWNTGNVTDMSQMFHSATSFNQPIADWNTSSVTNMSGMFHSAMNFNSPTGDWNTSSVTDMSQMFHRATSFNQPIADWNTRSVKEMTGMFFSASSFNQPIGNWNTAAVTNMVAMFGNAEAFNQPIGDWNTAAVTNMLSMFNGATSFNQPIGNWNTSAVTDMNGMFLRATSFNQPIGDWNTAAVTNMGFMFNGAISFNQPIGEWDTINVIIMNGIFSSATSFNQPIGDWDTSSVIFMGSMFAAATSFNQPIGEWDTANVTDMVVMFSEASSFNQDLSGWCMSNITSKPNQFDLGADAWTLPDSRPVWGTCPL